MKILHFFLKRTPFGVQIGHLGKDCVGRTYFAGRNSVGASIGENDAIFKTQDCVWSYTQHEKTALVVVIAQMQPFAGKARLHLIFG